MSGYCSEKMPENPNRRKYHPSQGVCWCTDMSGQLDETRTGEKKNCRQQPMILVMLVERKVQPSRVGTQVVHSLRRNFVSGRMHRVLSSRHEMHVLASKRRPNTNISILKLSQGYHFSHKFFLRALANSSSRFASTLFRKSFFPR